MLISELIGVWMERKEENPGGNHESADLIKGLITSHQDRNPMHIANTNIYFFIIKRTACFDTSRFFCLKWLRLNYFAKN